MGESYKYLNRKVYIQRDLGVLAIVKTRTPALKYLIQIEFYLTASKDKELFDFGQELSHIR